LLIDPTHKADCHWHHSQDDGRHSTTANRKSPAYDQQEYRHDASPRGRRDDVSLHYGYRYMKSKFSIKCNEISLKA
jgi:hypothetical protein